MWTPISFRKIHTKTKQLNLVRYSLFYFISHPLLRDTHIQSSRNSGTPTPERFVWRERRAAFFFMLIILLQPLPWRRISTINTVTKLCKYGGIKIIKEDLLNTFHQFWGLQKGKGATERKGMILKGL